MISATRATARMPPKTIGAVRKRRIAVEAHSGKSCAEPSVAVIVLAYTISKAKPKTKMSRTAKTTPHRRDPSPRWM